MVYVKLIENTLNVKIDYMLNRSDNKFFFIC